MSAHTPGPWAVMTNRQGYPYQISAPFSDPRKPGGITDVTRWASISLPSSPEGQANARLIAAAPEMLEALKAYDAAMTSCWGSPDDLPSGHPDAARCWPMARAAIARAEGRA
jgi:hypothetical protein